MEKAQLDQKIMELQPLLKRLTSKFTFYSQEDLIQECNLLLPNIIQKKPENLIHYISSSCYHHLIELQQTFRRKKEERFGNKEEEETLPLPSSEDELDYSIDYSLLIEECSKILTKEEISLLEDYSQGISLTQLSLKYNLACHRTVARKIASLIKQIRNFLKKEGKKNESQRKDKS